MTRKRIAITFASVPFIRGGAELCAESLRTELVKRGFEAELVSIPFQWCPKIELLKNCLIWRTLNIDEIAGQKIDLVIATKFPSYVISHPNKVTWLFHQHRAIYDLYRTPFSDFDPNSPEDQRIREQIIRIDAKTLQESQKIFTIARNTSNRLQLYNQIASATLYHPPKHYGRYYSEAYGDYILSVGRLEELKRTALLIRSLQYTDPKVKCVIAGTGGQETYLKRLTHDLKLENRVQFTGFVEDDELLRLYANCFAVYFAPFDEDYGYVTLEAFLSRKPIISCVDSGGVMEFAEHETNGLVANEADPLIFGELIDRLYHERSSLAPELGQHGYQRVKDIHWDDTIEQLTSTL